MNKVNLNIENEKRILSRQAEYLVYILSGKGRKTLVGVSEKEKPLPDDGSKNFSKLIYFEEFQNKTKAQRRKKQLDKLNDEERIKLIKKKNPELLNLIFTINDNFTGRAFNEGLVY